MQGIWVQSLGQKDPLGKGMATHSSILLAWENPWTEEPGGLQSTGLQRVRHDLVTKRHQQNGQVIKSLLFLSSIQAISSLFDQLVQRTDDCSFMTGIRRFLSAYDFGDGIFFSSLVSYLMYSS